MRSRGEVAAVGRGRGRGSGREVRVHWWGRRHGGAVGLGGTVRRGMGSGGRGCRELMDDDVIY
jgi:hypothetical protein